MYVSAVGFCHWALAMTIVGIPNVESFAAAVVVTVSGRGLGSGIWEAGMNRIHAPLLTTRAEIKVPTPT